MKVKFFLWIVEGNTEIVDKLYADRPEEIEKYAAEKGLKIRRRTEFFLEKGEIHEFKYIVPIYFRISVRDRYLLLLWKTQQLPWLERLFGKTYGIQTLELIDSHLIGGVVW